MNIEKIILMDVQPLFGGVRFFLRADGLVFFEDANFRSKIRSKKYKTSLTKEKVREIEKLVKKS